MKARKIKYIYLSNKYFDGTVYKTQIIDWLTLFSNEGVTFELYQIFHIKDILKIRFWLNQIKTIKRNTKFFTGFLFLLPSVGVFVHLNSLFLFLRLFRSLLQSDKVFIFSRSLLGKELNILKKISFSKVIFYFDARAASAEENKYVAFRNADFTLKKFKKIAHISHTEYKTLFTANKIFAVSQNLIDFFEYTYKIDRRKFILYPCLSDPTKFYYNDKIRRETRRNFKITDHTTVLLYSGGLSSLNWHITEEMFAFFNIISIARSDVIFFILSKDKFKTSDLKKFNPSFMNKLTFLDVENEQIFKFLDAADFGVLFRENTIMNNVASPSKFSEYILCGLPVIISEGVGDFSKFTIDHKLGHIVTDSELKYPHRINFDYLLERRFDRQYISQIGLKYLSKNSIINELVKNFKER